ncbi:histidine phosphatase family protein [Actinomyces sp. 2119]|uniref:Histidine phosphatase family protein n=1 Tax=Actinomyces lilanjuaniae TaxID=2321394 RepID=A0ABN5PUW4_9ACTO|nr:MULTISPECIES: histidine phosphatase family protein [Actinomyces]AYD90832.1 histidine phosphatase family protein [Actinomyces lilanjuaniae]RJF44932.1 histidine phosphatase family protein [Actinomyces sp. 2119]
MNLLLVRHGRTIGNVMNALDTGFPGNPLDDVGVAQAADLPGRLEAAGWLGKITTLWVSPILRARQTVAPVEEATGLEAQVRSGLREVLAGDLEMRTDVRSMRCYKDTTRSWMVGRTAARVPGSPEDGADTFARFDTVITEVAAQTPPAATALLVAHGTVLRLWTALAASQAAGVDPAWVAHTPMDNTAMSVVEGSPHQGWRLMSWNDGQWRAKEA